MMRLPVFLILPFLIFSCHTKEKRKGQEVALAGDKEDVVPIEQPNDTLEFFVDSTTIGRAGSSKVELTCFRDGDTMIRTSVRFYEKEKTTWRLHSSFKDENWMGSIEPEVTDFNNDGFKDLVYSKGTGARGGNVINNLLLFDKKGDSLV
ncbi:MAG: hypothetical protein EOP50_15215, partial [Sphingobacteriales bacterium]